MPTFVGQSEGVRQSEDVAVGLNPLASVDVCPQGQQAAGQGARVLISPPTYFSRQATEMILQLRRALAESPEAPHIQMWLGAMQLKNVDAARTEGKRCKAVIVLWEVRGTNSLELTLPEPADVPLRNMVRDRLCEFGSDRQQVTVLYYTISGLAAMLDNRYDEAVYYMDAANRIDLSCLRLPAAPQGAPAPMLEAPPPTDEHIDSQWPRSQLPQQAHQRPPPTEERGEAEGRGS